MWLCILCTKRACRETVTQEKVLYIEFLLTTDLSEVATTEHLKTKDQVSETKEQFKMSPNLRNIREAVLIP